MKEVNALGFECPMPVIMAKRVVKEEEENFKSMNRRDCRIIY